MSKDMSKQAFEAALEKHGITPPGIEATFTRSRFGSDYYDVGDGLSVPVVTGASRRATLAYLLGEQRKNRERKARQAAAIARRDELIGGRRDGERAGITHDGKTFEIKLSELTVEQCAAVVLALRAARGDV